MSTVYITHHCSVLYFAVLLCAVQYTILPIFLSEKYDNYVVVKYFDMVVSPDIELILIPFLHETLASTAGMFNSVKTESEACDT